MARRRIAAVPSLESATSASVAVRLGERPSGWAASLPRTGSCTSWVKTVTAAPLVCRPNAATAAVRSSRLADAMTRAAAAVAEVAAHESLEMPIILGVTLLTSIDEETLEQIGIGGQPAEAVRRLAILAKSAGLNGVVASAHEVPVIRSQITYPGFVVVCPGVRSARDAADDQRRIMSAADAIRAGADYVVVGRPVLNAPDPVKAARMIVEEIGSAWQSQTL